MPELTSRDKRLWRALIRACLRPGTDNTAEIVKAARDCAGLHKRFKIGKGAALPDCQYIDGEINRAGPFWRMMSEGRHLATDDIAALTRESLRDQAWAAERIMGDRRALAPRPPKSSPYSTRVLPPRADIDG